MTNGEKFKTVKEQTEAFEKFCDDNECIKCPCRNKGSGRILCAFSWHKLEYKEKLRLEPCPFCGGTPVMADNVETMRSLSYFVRCACGARTASAYSESVVAEIWNRRAK